MADFFSRLAVRKAPWWSLFVLWLLVGPVLCDQLPRQAAVATAHPLATEAAHEILEAGGNAFDAAVTASAVLAVVEPYSSGLGGGGFWLLHRADDGRQVMVDGRERAPLAATRDRYLDDAGEIVAGLSVNGPLSAGIPGEPAALAHIAEQYGKLPLARSLAPAIKLARAGFRVDAHYRKMAGFRLEMLQRYEAAAGQFLVNNEVPPLGHLIRQPDLAATLEQLAQKGREGFYAGEVAERLVSSVRQAGGLWSRRDLAEYRVVERAPVVSHYGEYRIVSAAPPSSGGVVLAEMLNMLELRELNQMPALDRVHYLVEVMRRAYRDRALYLGDPDHVDIPVSRLISKAHARALASEINMQQATPSTGLTARSTEGTDTTHFSIIDRAGNRVAATLSINYPFGSCFVAQGTGVLLNDEMDDFSAKPGQPNVYGLVGAEANAIAPGKRMLSSMTPTFIEGPEQVAILGTPGGSRIISMVLLGALQFVGGKAPDDWVNSPRFHHQYLPDRIQLEPGALDPEIRKGLETRGHVLQPLEAPYGNMQAVLWDRKTGAVSGASDPRGLGSAIP